MDEFTHGRMKERLLKPPAVYLNLFPDAAPSFLRKAKEKDRSVTYYFLQATPGAACPGSNVRAGTGEGPPSAMVQWERCLDSQPSAGPQGEKEMLWGTGPLRVGSLREGLGEGRRLEPGLEAGERWRWMAGRKATKGNGKAAALPLYLRRLSSCLGAWVFSCGDRGSSW